MTEPIYSLESIAFIGKKNPQLDGLFIREELKAGSLVFAERPWVFIDKKTELAICNILKSKPNETPREIILLYHTFATGQAARLVPLKGNNSFVISKSQPEALILKKYKTKLTRTFGDKVQKLSFSTLTAFAAKVRTNIIRTSGLLENASSGFGLYQSCSNINHSCDPTCKYVFRNDGSVEVIALRDIKKDEEITIDTVGVNRLCCVHKRRAHILVKEMYLCLCFRCIEDEKINGPVTAELKCKSLLHDPENPTLSSMEINKYLSGKTKELEACDTFDDYYEKFFFIWREYLNFYYEMGIENLAYAQVQKFSGELPLLKKETIAKIKEAVIAYCFYLIEKTLPFLLNTENRNSDTVTYFKYWNVCIKCTSWLMIINEKNGAKYCYQIKRLFTALLKLLKKGTYEGVFFHVESKNLFEKIIQSLTNVDDSMSFEEMTYFSSELSKASSGFAEYEKIIKLNLKNKTEEERNALIDLEKVAYDVNFKNERKEEEKEKTTTNSNSENPNKVKTEGEFKEAVITMMESLKIDQLPKK
jgi:hypothetical protein